MSKEMFLKGLQTFDENFNLIADNDTVFDDMDKNKLKEEKYFQAYNRIDIDKVRAISNHNPEERYEEGTKRYRRNCFASFFDLEYDEMMFFFRELTKIHLGLIYLDDFSEKWKDAGSQKNRNDTFVGKIDDVLKLAEEVNYALREETINDLKYLQNTFNNNHFTERQLFQDLLCTVALLLNNMKNGRVVAEITNSLIKEYFERDITFTRDTKIGKYEQRTYRYYDNQGISLFHE